MASALDRVRPQESADDLQRALAIARHEDMDVTPGSEPAEIGIWRDDQLGTSAHRSRVPSLVLLAMSGANDAIPGGDELGASGSVDADVNADDRRAAAGLTHAVPEPEEVTAPPSQARAHALGGQLAALGPGVCSLSVSELATWHMVKVGAASSDALLRLAEDLELDQGRTGRWRRMLPGPSGAIVVTAGVRCAPR